MKARVFGFGRVTSLEISGTMESGKKEQAMHQVNLNDQLYRETCRRAEAAGFSSVDEYVAVVLSQDYQLDDENLDQFFTPERLALIDQSAADVAAGNVHTMDQVRESLASTRDAWLWDYTSGK